MAFLPVDDQLELISRGTEEVIPLTDLRKKLEKSISDNKPLIASVGLGTILVTGACSGGDLLESNGDGTAKVQDDDIIRSKTIGKVTIGDSNTGVKSVSCVLYCG